MKKTALSLLIALSCLLVSLICPFSAHAESADKALVVYFSRMGNTENIESVDAVSSASFLVRDGALAGNAQTIAGWIADELGCETFGIVAETPYPADYNATTDAARSEQRANARPALVEDCEGLEDCQTVYLVYPNWWADLPMPVYSFLDAYDLSGKTIVCFVTHGGSGFSRTLASIQALEPDAEVIEGLSIRDSKVPDAEADVRAWVREH